MWSLGRIHLLTFQSLLSVVGIYPVRVSHRLPLKRLLDLTILRRCVKNYRVFEISCSHILLRSSLRWNQIASIASGAFTGLGNLPSLCAFSRPNPLVYLLFTTFGRRDLSSQGITSIADGAFSGLNSLASLCVAVMSVSCACLHTLPHSSLNGNQITSIASGAFTGLGSLPSLCALSAESACWLLSRCICRRDLSYQSITSIADGAFSGLNSLASLCVAVMSVSCACLHMLPHSSLDRNWVTSIASGAFQGLGKLTTLFDHALWSRGTHEHQARLITRLLDRMVY